MALVKKISIPFRFMAFIVILVFAVFALRLIGLGHDNGKWNKLFKISGVKKALAQSCWTINVPPGGGECAGGGGGGESSCCGECY